MVSEVQQCKETGTAPNAIFAAAIDFFLLERDSVDSSDAEHTAAVIGEKED